MNINSINPTIAFKSCENCDEAIYVPYTELKEKPDTFEKAKFANGHRCCHSHAGIDFGWQDRTQRCVRGHFRLHQHTDPITFSLYSAVHSASRFTKRTRNSVSPTCGKTMPPSEGSRIIACHWFSWWLSGRRAKRRVAVPVRSSLKSSGFPYDHHLQQRGTCIHLRCFGLYVLFPHDSVAFMGHSYRQCSFCRRCTSGWRKFHRSISFAPPDSYD